MALDLMMNPSSPHPFVEARLAFPAHGDLVQQHSTTPVLLDCTCARIPSVRRG